MILGVDFDNTIVSYEGLFHRIAVENGWIPETVCKSKDRVRDYMRIHDNEVKWTKLQGIVYGTKMELANPFNGVKNFLAPAKNLTYQLGLLVTNHASPTLVRDSTCMKPLLYGSRAMVLLEPLLMVYLKKIFILSLPRRQRLIE